MYCMECEVILISIFTLDSKKKKIVQWNDNLDEMCPLGSQGRNKI